MMTRLFACFSLIVAAVMPVCAQAAEPSRAPDARSVPTATPTAAKNQTTATPAGTPDKSAPSAAPATATPPKPAPDVWSATEIAAAHKACKQILKKVSAVVEPVPPIKKGECGTPAPVRLIQIGKVPVTFEPAPTVNCAMVAALAKWLKEGVQPLARKHLGARVEKMTIMSSYSCRRAYGRKRTSLSEHALANALDIGSFVTAKGLETTLLANWGPTRRALLAQAKAAAEAAAQKSQTVTAAASGAQPPTAQKQEAIAGRKPTRVAAATTAAVAQDFTTSSIASDPGAFLPPLPERRPTLKERWLPVHTKRVAERQQQAQEQRKLEPYRRAMQKFLYPSSRLGGPRPKVDVKSPVAPRAGGPEDQKAFLKAAHVAACKIFGTVLGPEANNAHLNHFHVDLAYRRHRNYCR